MADKKIHGTHLSGERITDSKLTGSMAIDARRRYASGEKIAKIAKSFNVGWTTIKDVIRGRTWKHV